MTRVTVIVPTYNSARTLPRALESLQEQSMADWECIVIDAGSDTSYNIARAFGERDPRIEAYRLPVGVARAEAVNFAAAMAKGEYVTNLDSDDYYIAGDFLELVYEKLDDDPSVIGAYTDFIEWDEPAGMKYVHRCPDFSRDALLNGNYVAFSALVVRGAMWLDPRWEPIADWDFLLRITRDRPLTHIRLLCVTRRIYAGQWSNKTYGVRDRIRRILLSYRHGGVRAALSQVRR